MPTLTSQLANDFNSPVQQRGDAYFRGGRVVIKTASAVSLVAKVRGTVPYRVDLQREGRQMQVSCTCPYFPMGACKHIWAVLLAADRQRLLQGDGPSDGLRLVLRANGETHGGEYLDEDLNANDLDGGDEGLAVYTRPRNPAWSLANAQGMRLPSKPATLDWRARMAQLAQSQPLHSLRHDVWPQTRELLYLIDVVSSQAGKGLHLDIVFRDRKKDGTWSKPKSQHLSRNVLGRLPDVEDRRILAFLQGATQVYGHANPGGPGYDTVDSGYDGALLPRYRLSNLQPQLILPDICKTGRCRLRLHREDEEPQWLPMAWDDAPAWQLRLAVHRRDEHYEVGGALWRDETRMELTAPVLLVETGFGFTQSHLFRYEHHGAFHWLDLLRAHGPITVPAAQADEFMTELLSQSELPPIDLDEELRYEEISLAPKPQLTVTPDQSSWKREQLRGELSFDYGGTVVGLDEARRGIVQTAHRRVLLRDTRAEQAAEQRLLELGCRWVQPGYHDPKRRAVFATSRLPKLVADLASEGWRVDAEGKIYRAPGQFDLSVSSGVDWFELHGKVDFGDVTATLPQLLAALRRGENMIRLGDGSFGLLPEQWLQQYGVLAALGTAQGGHVRFARSQALLLDALLATRPETPCDELFTRVRNELRGFAGITPIDQPAGFEGALRPYQQEALGWFDFLRRFGFGGCLADDMGLGKTVQILALLESRRELRERAAGAGSKDQARTAAPAGECAVAPAARPSLVVMPRSLIFNWKQEAARFAPRLRVLDHTGILRLKDNDQFEDYDLVLTTYGTLRNDAAHLKDVRFDYVILDESQAIKNADSASAKAARLLNGAHRLALSGTPIENHLGELWSLFEFLNPGMLGAASVFKLSQGAMRNPDEETRKLLAHALRPFLLRRTKEQVVRELPAKVEQTLYCELDSKQRKLYDELRDHYRNTLLERVQKEGIAKAKIQILEALLRLRQAAIHPGLLDEKRKEDPSAKLDMLLPRLLQVVEEGHKILVFSQFTGMLAILRKHLDRSGITYEYLDGKTRDRRTCVERFQTDPQCKLFLISLKAGGVGLNLTAAQYVFLLDPWWNPAVEAQAIDRAHRIGQVNQVFAYRLIARGTVEEKVLELQNTKRELADAIIGAGDGVIRNLGRAELELLLS